MSPVADILLWKGAFSTPPFFGVTLLAHTFFFDSMHCKPLTLLFFFHVSIVPNWAYVSSFKMAPVFFEIYPHWSSSPSLLPGTARYSGSLCPPVLESAASPRSPSSLLWTVVFRNSDLGAKPAYCYWSVVTSGPFSRKSWEIPFFPFLLNQEIILSNSRVPYLSLLHICIFLLPQWEPRFWTLWINLFILSIP